MESKGIHGYIYGESALQSTIKKVKLMLKIRWRDPELTKPKISRWNRNHTNLAEWFHRWYVEFNIPTPLPEKIFHIKDMTQIIEVPTLVARIPEIK